MIDFCSASANGNRVPEEANNRPELLWVRFCDRLEAIGTIGIVRCYQYTMEKDRSLHNPGTTPRPQSESELWEYVTPERFDEY
jgi:hypothetical protein